VAPLAPVALSEPPQCPCWHAAPVIKPEQQVFIKDIAAEVRAKLGHLGGPLNAASRKVATRLAIKCMSNRNHRHTHIVRDLPYVLISVQTVTDAERDLIEHLFSEDFYEDNVLNLEREGA
jgi:hypothetical protein